MARELELTVRVLRSLVTQDEGSVQAHGCVDLNIMVLTCLLACAVVMVKGGMLKVSSELADCLHRDRPSIELTTSPSPVLPCRTTPPSPSSLSSQSVHITSTLPGHPASVFRLDLCGRG